MNEWVNEWVQRMIMNIILPVRKNIIFAGATLIN